MERRIKSVNKNSNSVSVESKSSMKEKKLKKSDTFKEMKRRISSSFGRLNVLKDDSNRSNFIPKHENCDGVIDNGGCTLLDPDSQKQRCYSSTAIHEIYDASNGGAPTGNGSNCVKTTTTPFSSITDLWRRSTSSSVKRHRSLGNVHSLLSGSSGDPALNAVAAAAATQLPRQSGGHQKQCGPAAKISAKIRSRRGVTCSVGCKKGAAAEGLEVTPSVAAMRPHSVSREPPYLQMTVSGYHPVSFHDPMSTSLTMSRPRSDGHCFDTIMTSSITNGSRRQDTHNHSNQPQPCQGTNRGSSNSQWQRPAGGGRSRRLVSASSLAAADQSSGSESSPRANHHLPVSPRMFGRTDSYQKLDMLGEGSYATVYKGHSNLTNQTVALKEIRINPEEGVPFTAIREASLLKNLRHANIVILHDIVHARDTLTFVFEFVHSDLSKYIERHYHSGGGGTGAPGAGGGIRAHNVQLLLWQLLRGLAFCHNRRILHRDLKPQNLLISEQGELKLADFGLARAKSVPSRTFSNEVVTLWYRPPDVLLGATDYNAALDMWGVGCIFVEMIGGSAIFPGLKDTDDQLDKIFKVMGSPNEKVWPAVASLPHYAEFCLSHITAHKGRPLHRMVPRLFGIPHAESLALAFLQIRPELRVLARPAMAHPYFEELPPALGHLPDNASIFTVPGVRLLPDSPLQLTSPLVATRHPRLGQIPHSVYPAVPHQQSRSGFDLSEIIVPPRSTQQVWRCNSDRDESNQGDGNHGSGIETRIISI